MRNKKLEASKRLETAITEESFVLCGNYLIENGFKVVDKKGARYNNGYVFALGDAFIEVWDNTDKTVKNIAVRPVKRLMTHEECEQWGSNRSVFYHYGTKTLENDLTRKLDCTSEEALYMVLTACIRYAQEEQEAKAKKEAA